MYNSVVWRSSIFSIGSLKAAGGSRGTKGKGKGVRETVSTTRARLIVRIWIAFIISRIQPPSVFAPYEKHDPDIHIFMHVATGCSNSLRAWKIHEPTAKSSWDALERNTWDSVACREKYLLCARA